MEEKEPDILSVVAQMSSAFELVIPKHAFGEGVRQVAAESSGSNGHCDRERVDTSELDDEWKVRLCGCLQICTTSPVSRCFPVVNVGQSLCINARSAPCASTQQ